MLTLDYKLELVSFCILELQKKELELQQEIDEAMKSANDYGAPKDRYDGFKNQQMRKIEMFTAQQHLIQSDIRTFQQIDLLHPCLTVKMGALFTTNNQTIFIATAMGKLLFKEKTIVVISPKVPFYEAFKDTKKGDSVLFRDQKMSVIDLI